MKSVSVVSCCYGGYDRFREEWWGAVEALERRPDDIWVTLSIGEEWEHPQAGYLDAALRAVETEWAWIVDYDDLVLPDALNGIEDVEGDVWLAGYIRSNGKGYIPRALPNVTYLNLSGNPYPAGSFVRVEAALAVGGFDDLAFQDWSLWRKLARAGATFSSSGRAHYRYRQHKESRTETELRTGREDNLRAMRLLDSGHGQSSPST